MDAEVEKTKQKLQFLGSQIRELESELQHGIEGRRKLVEELEDLSPTNPILQDLNREIPNSSNDNNNEGRLLSYLVVPINISRTPSRFLIESSDI